MDIRTVCIDLLKRENSMITLWNKQPYQLPDIKGKVRKTVMLLAIWIGVFFLRKWMMGIQDNLFAADRDSVGGIFLRVPVGICFLALVILGIWFIFRCFALFSDIGNYRFQKRSNGILDDRRDNILKEYDQLLQQATEMKKADPALAERKLFFEGPHPLECQLPVKQKTPGGVIHQIGEMALRVPDEHTLRLDGYYGPKNAKLRELPQLLQDPNYPYACPIWDADFIKDNPDMDCSIYTLTRIKLKPVPLDNQDHENKLTPQETLDLYHSSTDPMSIFIRSGIGDRPNLSKAEDSRTSGMAEHIREHSKQIHETVRLDKERLKYTSEWRYGCVQAYVQQMGYLVTSAKDKSQVIALIIPRFFMPTYSLFYSLDLFYDEQSASRQFVGRVMSMTWNSRDDPPEFAMTVQAALQDKKLPAFDPLQECPANLDHAEWHYLLRTLAAKEQ